MSDEARRPLHVLLPTLGSAGDVHPFIALGVALQSRGHRVTLLTYPGFQQLIEEQGLGFQPVGTIESQQATLADPQLFSPSKGFEVVARRIIIPAIAEIYRRIESHAAADTVVVSHFLAFGARIAQEKLGVPNVTVQLAPAGIRSLVDAGMVGPNRISEAQPMWFKKAFFCLADWVMIDRCLQRPLNEFRAGLGLAPVQHPFRDWLHSPQCEIGFFPEWFARPQADWPPQIRLLGFPLWNAAGDRASVSTEVEDFLSSGEPPVIFTAGTGGSTMHRFFRESVEAVREIGVRAILVSKYPEQLPRNLPEGVKAFDYLPFSEVLHRAALLVHHGGIGTTAQAIASAIPQLVVPHAHDQFDNGWRIEQLGLGKCIFEPRYRKNVAVKAIRGILKDESLKQRVQEFSARVDSDATINLACEAIEGLAAMHRESQVLLD